MEPTTETSTDQPGGDSGAPTHVPLHENNRPAASLAPQQWAPAPCPSCGDPWASQARSFVYALGRIGPRFPSLGAEKEFAQIAGRAEDTTGLTDRETAHSILSKSENRYLARQVCWVLSIEGLETYILVPRYPADVDLLIEAIRPAPSPMDMDVVIGVRGPIASPEMCNGLMIPIVAFDQIYSFDRGALMKSIPKPKTSAEKFTKAAEEVLDRIMQMADNAGATDEHRALNYCAVRYPAIYAMTAEAYEKNSSLSAVEVRSSPLSGIRKVLDVIFCYTNRSTDVIEKYFVRVDVTEEFPFLVTKMSPYYDR